VPLDGLAAELTAVIIARVIGNRIANTTRTFVRVTEEKNVEIEVDRVLTKFLLCRSFGIFSPERRTLVMAPLRRTTVPKSFPHQRPNRETRGVATGRLCNAT
jgi:hypothetical protein